MLDALLADGLGSGLADKVAGYAIKGLAVAGGFLIGYFLGGVVAWGLDRWVFAKKAPDQLKKAVALVAGVALAILVALIVFGEGGNGLFGGGSQGDGKGTATPEAKGKPEPSQPVVPPKKDEVPTPKPIDPVAPSKPADTIIRVTILGGSDVPGDERFYVVEDGPKPKTFAELKEAVTARKQKEKGTVGLSITFRPTNAPSLDPVHYSISQLTNWARDVAKLDVTTPASK